MLDHPQVKECLSSNGYDEREVDDKELAKVLLPLEIVDAPKLADESYEKQKEQHANCLDDEKAINQHLCVFGDQVVLRIRGITIAQQGESQGKVGGQHAGVDNRVKL